MNITIQSNLIYKVILSVLLILAAQPDASAQKKPLYDDGPYIFREGDSLRIQYVLQTKAYDTVIHKSQAGMTPHRGTQKF